MKGGSWLKPFWLKAQVSSVSVGVRFSPAARVCAASAWRGRLFFLVEPILQEFAELAGADPSSVPLGCDSPQGLRGEGIEGLPAGSASRGVPAVPDSSEEDREESPAKRTKGGRPGANKARREGGQPLHGQSRLAAAGSSP